MIETTKVVCCGGKQGFKTDNGFAADLYSKAEMNKSGKGCDIESFSSLKDMMLFLKHENPDALGIIAFRDNEGIMSSGINAISDSGLSIKDAFRLDTERMLGIKGLFKDYLVVSGKHNSFEFSLNDKKNWRTLLIAKNISLINMSKIDVIMSACDISFESMKLKDGRFYIEAKCHHSLLKECLEIISDQLIKIKVLGSYTAPEIISEEIVKEWNWLKRKKRGNYLG